MPECRVYNAGAIEIGVANEQRGNRTEELRNAPREGFSIAHFLTSADIDRSARWYEKGIGDL